MQFYVPGNLIFLLSLPLLGSFFLLGDYEWRRRVSRLGNQAFLKQRLMPELSMVRKRFAWGLLGLVYLFSVLALARPQWGEEVKKVERKGVDLIFLLDTSLSMLAEDVKPNRLEKSKLEIKALLQRLKGDRIGMIAFAGSSFLQCPLTLDHSAFLLFVDALDPSYIPDPGTSLSRAIELGIRSFPEESRKHRAILIFSDGEDHEGGVTEALGAAKKAGVRIYTLGMGTFQGEPIPLRSSSEGRQISGYKKDREGQVVMTRLNADLLGQIARETGGLYLQASAGEKEVDLLVKHLETLGERRLKERVLTERENHFQLFIFIAFLCLLLEMLLRARRLTPVTARIGPLLLGFFLLTGLVDSASSLVRKGNQLAKEKKYESAVETYRKAEVKRPREAVVRYNLGTVLYQLYGYRDSESELEQAISLAKSPSVKAKALYNFGNTQYRLGKFDQAVEAYKKALDLDPKDEDAKYNLEFLRKKKAEFEKKQQERQKDKKQQQPQPQQQNQSQPQPQPQSEQQGSEGGGGTSASEQQDQDKEGKESQKQEAEGNQAKEKEDTSQEGKQQGDKAPVEPEQSDEGKKEQGNAKPGDLQKGQEPLQGQMNMQSAMQLLEALREGEKKLQDLRRPPVRNEGREVWKDW